MGQNRADIISSAKLGERLFTKTDDFILSDPYMRIMRPSYNSLCDPHLRKFFHRKDMQERLRKGNFITKDNDVKCSFREYKTRQRYLEHLKHTSDRTVGTIQRAKLKKFLEDQEKGLISSNFVLTDMTELLLEEEVQCLRQVLKSEAATAKTFMREMEDNEEEFLRELYLMSWKVEERARLRKIEREVRIEWNREKQIREFHKMREEKRYTAMVRKIYSQQDKMLEKIKISEESVMAQRLSKAKQLQQPTTPTTRAPMLMDAVRKSKLPIRAVQRSKPTDKVQKGAMKSKIQVSAV